jgi:hypothetical protein
MTILNTIMLIWMTKEPNGGACTAAVASLSDGFKEIGGKIKLRDHPHGPWSDFQRAGLQTPRYVSPLCRSIR